MGTCFEQIETLGNAGKKTLEYKVYLHIKAPK